MFAGRTEKVLLLFECNVFLGVVQLQPEVVRMLMREVYVNFIRLGQVPVDLLRGFPTSLDKCLLGPFAPRFIDANF